MSDLMGSTHEKAPCRAAHPGGPAAASRVRPTATPTEPSAAEPTPAAEKLVTLADALFVRARLQPDGTWTFEVTVQHEDTGWEHCADRWEVLTPEGEVLAT